MALSDLKRTKNKWALHTWNNHTLFIKLGDIDYPGGRIRVEELYQTNPMGKVKAIDIGSNFDKKAIVCRENISSWLKIFYPSLRRVT